MELCQINRKDLRKFGIAFGIALAVIGTIQLLKGRFKICPWFYIAAGLFAILGIFIPKTIKPLYIILNKAAHLIGNAVTALILIIVFYFVLTPISLIAKIFRKDFLDVTWGRKADTYWIKKEPSAEGVETYEKQF